MKTAVIDREVSASSELQQNAFSISMGPGMFRILTSSIYSDVQRIAMQEPICNAIDANRAAGRGDVPVTIHLPSRLEPFFSVSDTGTGLSHDAVMRLYTTYGASTKSTENNSIGGFGLGSKAPLAYTDTFEVASRFEGTLRRYAAFIGSDGVPSIALLVTEPTAEPNGLTVSFPVKPGDISIFVSKAADILTYLSPAPIVEGDSAFQIPTISYSLRAPNWGLRVAGSRRVGYGSGESQGRVIMGGIAYPIDVSALGYDYSTREHKLANIGLDIFASIGEFAPSVSRDALNYDAATIFRLKQRIQDVLDAAPSIISDSLIGCTTLYEARCLLQSLIYFIHNVLKITSVTWRGTSVSLNLVSDATHNPAPTNFKFAWVAYYDLKSERLNVRNQEGIGVNFDPTTVYIFDDGTQPLIGRVILNYLRARKAQWEAANPSGVTSITHYTDPPLLIGRGTPQQRQWFVDFIGNAPMLDLAALPLPAALPKATIPATRSEIITVEKHDFARGKWETATVDLKNPGVYVLSVRGWTEGASCLSTAENCEAFRPPELYRVTASQRGRFECRPHWKTLKQWQMAKLEELNKEQSLSELLANDRALESLPKAAAVLVHVFDSSIAKLPRILSDFLAEYDKIQEKAPLCLGIREAIDATAFAVVQTPPTTTLTAKWEALKEKCPMLEWALTDRKIPDTLVLDYIILSLNRRKR